MARNLEIMLRKLVLRVMRSALIYIILFVFGATALQAQDGPDVVGVGKDTLVKKYQKVMIIPFEQNMYLCGVQPHLAAASGKTHNEIIDFFRHAVAKELQDQFLYTYNTASLIHYRDSTKDIYRAYDAIKYKAEIAPIEEEEKEEVENPIDKAKSLFISKSKTKKLKRGRTKEGQIVSVKNTEQKFMNVVVRKKETLKYLSEKYAADLFVYVTEMDIENDISNQTAFINSEYERYLRLHFSMVDKEGKIVNKGIVYTKFPNQVNNINDIKKNYLPIVAKKMAAKLPQPVKPNVDQGKAVNVSEKIKN